ncbi:MAG: flagellin fliC [Rickettsiaceae bacterium]|jgi:hypothetical protein|nr:flagellin fliC [Rickettsiaceae bacterium]
MPEGIPPVKIVNYNVYGVVMDTIMKSLRGTKPTASFTLANNPTIEDFIDINGTIFNFVTTINDPLQEILIGSDIPSTLTNTLSILNNSEDINVSKATYACDYSSSKITATYKYKGTKSQHNFTLSTNLSLNNIVINETELTGGSSPTGVDISGLNHNESFIGKIQGFEVTYIEPNKVDIQIKVGECTYQASNVDTNPRADSWVTLIDGVSGGSFRIQLASHLGMRISSSDAAEKYALKLDKAFSALTFTQTRKMNLFANPDDIYNGDNMVGSLLETSIYLTNDKFDNIKIEKVKFKAPGADAIKGAKKDIEDLKSLGAKQIGEIRTELSRIKSSDESLTSNISTEISNLGILVEEFSKSITDESINPKNNNEALAIKLLDKLNELESHKQTNIGNIINNISQIKISEEASRTEDEPVLENIKTNVNLLDIATQSLTDNIKGNINKIIEQNESVKDAVIEVTINGEKFISSPNNGGIFNNGSLVNITNKNQPNKSITFLVGGTDLNLSSISNSKAIKESFKNALGLTETPIIVTVDEDEEISLTTPEQGTLETTGDIQI